MSDVKKMRVVDHAVVISEAISRRTTNPMENIEVDAFLQYSPWDLL
jgi:hypothetical protein